jgi:steroid delta-isomerase-like uncharacterized protein
MEATTRQTQLDPGFVEEWSSRYIAAWQARDPDKVAELCTDDIVWNDPALPEPARGRDAVRAFVAASARSFPDFSIEEIGSPMISPTEPIALQRYRLTGTMRGPWDYMGLAPTGQHIDVLGVDQWEFRGDQLCELRTYYDSLDMSRQLGVLPPLGSTADRVMARVQNVQARFQRRKS